MQHATYVWVHIRKAKHTVFVLFNGLGTLDLKLWRDAKWSNCVQIHALCTGNKVFRSQKFECPECAQLRFVCCSIHETYTERFFMHYSVAFCSPYKRGRKKIISTLKNDIYVLLSVPVCKTRPTKICMFANQLYPKLRIMHKKWHFHDTPVQLVQNVHRFSSCAIGHVMLHSSALCTHRTIELPLVQVLQYSNSLWIHVRKAKHTPKCTVSVLFKALCTLDLKISKTYEK